MSIGERLKEERERLGKNQTEFAEIGGSTRKTQFNYESGDRFPSADYLARISQYGADIQYIVTGVVGAGGISEADRQVLRLWWSSTAANRDSARRILMGESDRSPAFQQTFGKVGGVFHAGSTAGGIDMSDAPKRRGK